MASTQKKKNNGINTAKDKNRKKTVADTASVGKKNKKVKPTEKKEKPQHNRPRGLAVQLMPFVFAVAAVFFFVCLISNGVGSAGWLIQNVFFGLFGGAAFTIPVYLLLAAFMWNTDVENGYVAWKVFCSVIAFVSSATLMHFLTSGPDTLSVPALYTAGIAKNGGGLVGGLCGVLLIRGFGTVLSLILLFAVLFVFVLLIFGITPRGLWILIAYKVKMSQERAAARRSLAEEEQAAQIKKVRKPVPAVPVQLTIGDVQDPPVLSVPNVRRKNGFDVDVEIEDADDAAFSAEADAAASVNTADEELIDERIFDEVMRRTQDRLEKNGLAVLPAENELLAAEDADEAAADEDDLPWNEIVTAETQYAAEGAARLARAEDEELDLTQIFTESTDEELLARLHNVYGATAQTSVDTDTGSADAEIELSVERRQIRETTVKPSAPISQPSTVSAPPAEVEMHEYVFPPLELLTKDEGPHEENIAEELRENASRLVRTLEDFHVKTKIVNVSRGPTITRYELLPEPGTRVRSIANLVDDIALNLATGGVRIEAPIPGKSAVGIEVPNKNSTTVHLRTLLENPAFGAAKSRITSALGQDVAGADIFLDVARMPHLLIAGATGMGKSVCINGLIVSLLYKAKPDELKLIMVDPKKVELNIYNGIPHLYMPVVSDPKKAAGALSWAVSEMERRYSLIEEVGVRDIRAYNEITKNDPEYEFLPQFVIIIDELADLMMTAKNDVEDSICRIAQKARAAGMHLIIGTQRPSVDVITGLIKANFPSRISFRVSSQIDSRTIIDRAGAEALVGRGDMLYSPVGAHEPIRVQGAYVSEEDVEKVVEYIKTHNGRAEYDRNAIEEIERNAASIGAGKKGAAGGDEDMGGEEDPMLRPALELAVESGKISTSLIQRRLSLGYGRAAKLIDRMEQLGYVSAPEGQKPRTVLLSKEEFMEMVLRDTDS